MPQVVAEAWVAAPVETAFAVSQTSGGGITELWTADRDFSYFADLATRNPMV